MSRLATAADDLLARSEAVVTGVLRENAGRWETLSAADRARVEEVARGIAERLLHEPALVLDAAEQAGDAARVRLARDLLGVSDPGRGDAVGGQHHPALPSRVPHALI